MYERFTDRARKVMQLANQEAQRFNHEYIGTEHMLLGLVKEGTGVAANVPNTRTDKRDAKTPTDALILRTSRSWIAHENAASSPKDSDINRLYLLRRLPPCGHCIIATPDGVT